MMKRAFLLLVVLGIAVGIGVAGTLYKRTTEPFKGYDGAEQFVTIQPGSGSRTIGQRLIEAGVIRDDATYRAALWRSGRARSLQASTERGSTLSLNTASSERAICSCWAYALGKAERCTRWAATVIGRSGQPGICFRPGIV